MLIFPLLLLLLLLLFLFVRSRSAALSADYVLHRFVHLLPLLFLHGRYNYYRTAKVVFFSFYKNMVFPVPIILFSFYSYNSGQVRHATTTLIDRDRARRRRARVRRI
jgi:magnesium-transporting ATPase (P-type)